MPDRRWEGARVEYLAAFKVRGGPTLGAVRAASLTSTPPLRRQAFEEAGAGDRAISCLRYHLLANMLAESRINPFDR